ncbi:hypothetical protein OG339_20020 [Streptosporangium sp. NBC_01495]|uniref:hypothetical protein n=1 Tax=Streptosporangium sp. NBC_01495 TaxID=2903899 RepID=UPI002E31FC78|nr:hypothetical protein [Streptosporangium sp. NBC_01495]
MTFIYEGERPKVLRAQVDGKDGYVRLPNQDDPEGAIYFSSWQGGLTRRVSELSLIIGQSPQDNLPPLDEYLQAP